MMIDIQKPSLDTKDILDHYLQFNKYKGCEFSSINSVFWCDYYHTTFTILEDMLVFCKEQDGRVESFTFPVGEHNPREAFDQIMAYFLQENMPFSMYAVEEEMFELIDSWYPGKFQIEYDRDAADYLYDFETLAYLKGKKLHGKRNHIHRFEENYPDYQYERINGRNWRECLELELAWEKANNQDGQEDKLVEQRMIAYCLEHRKGLGMVGALLRVEGKVVAFTLGEPLTEDTFVVHFEKAIAEIQGAYPMINREFVRNELQGFAFINREEDMGIPGLRRAKLSYQPIRLIGKGHVTLLDSFSPSGVSEQNSHT